jgi:hypothetical protein
VAGFILMCLAPPVRYGLGSLHYAEFGRHSVTIHGPQLRTSWAEPDSRDRKGPPVLRQPTSCHGRFLSNPFHFTNHPTDGVAKYPIKMSASRSGCSAQAQGVYPSACHVALRQMQSAAIHVHMPRPFGTVQYASCQETTLL